MEHALTASGTTFAPVLDRASLAAQAKSNPVAARARVPELMAACQAVESVFLTQLMRVMRQGESKDKLFGGGLADGIYRDLLDDQLANEMATVGSTGIAQMLYDQLEAASLPAKVAAGGAEQARASHAKTQDAEARGTDTVASGIMEAPDTMTNRRTAP